MQPEAEEQGRPAATWVTVVEESATQGAVVPALRAEVSHTGVLEGHTAKTMVLLEAKYSAQLPVPGDPHLYTVQLDEDNWHRRPRKIRNFTSIIINHLLFFLILKQVGGS